MDDYVTCVSDELFVGLSIYVLNYYLRSPALGWLSKYFKVPSFESILNVRGGRDGCSL